MQLLRGKKVDTDAVGHLRLVVVLGGATIWFHNATFIKWKPSVLVLGDGARVLDQPGAVPARTCCRRSIGEQLELPAPVWQRLNFAWVAFFALMGVLNLYVAYNFSTSVWASFKAFGADRPDARLHGRAGLLPRRHLKPRPSVGRRRRRAPRPGATAGRGTR